MIDERVRKQIELLRKADRDRVKNGVVLLILGVVLIGAAFWIRVKIEVASTFAAQSGNQWMLPMMIKDLVSSYFAVRVIGILGVVFSVWGIRELIDRNERAVLLALVADLEQRSKS